MSEALALDAANVLLRRTNVRTRKDSSTSSEDADGSFGQRQDGLQECLLGSSKSHDGCLYSLLSRIPAGED